MKDREQTEQQVTPTALLQEIAVSSAETLNSNHPNKIRCEKSKDVTCDANDQIKFLS